MARPRKPNIIEITVKEKHGPHLLNKFRFSREMLEIESYETFRDQITAIMYRKYVEKQAIEAMMDLIAFDESYEMTAFDREKMHNKIIEILKNQTPNIDGNTDTNTGNTEG
jgi:hypothetical protein